MGIGAHAKGAPRRKQARRAQSADRPVPSRHEAPLTPRALDAPQRAPLTTGRTSGTKGGVRVATGVRDAARDRADDRPRRVKRAQRVDWAGPPTPDPRAHRL